jgi:hypothetical protein
MIAQSLASGGTIIRTARNWRLHVKHRDSAADPRDGRRGLFFAQLGYHIVHLSPEAAAATQFVPVSDLRALPEVEFQSTVDVWFRFLLAYFCPSLIAIFGWGEGAFNAFLIAGCLRLVVAQHIADGVTQVPAVVNFLSKQGTWSAKDQTPNLGTSVESEGMLRSGSMLDVHDFQAPDTAERASERGSERGSDTMESAPLIVLGRRTTLGGVDLKLEPATSPSAMEELLRTMVADILKVSHGDIKSRTPLMDLGFDS